MTNPEFIESKSMTLVEAREILHNIEKRDKELGYLSNKAKEYLDGFVTLTVEKKDELLKKLQDLGLTRLREEHMMKIIDFLPKTIDELKVVLQAYPLSLPKKDQEAIVGAVKDFV